MRVSMGLLCLAAALALAAHAATAAYSEPSPRTRLGSVARLAFTWTRHAHS
jgi:hypothetical protein